MTSKVVSSNKRGKDKLMVNTKKFRDTRDAVETSIEQAREDKSTSWKVSVSKFGKRFLPWEWQCLKEDRR